MALLVFSERERDVVVFPPIQPQQPPPQLSGQKNLSFSNYQIDQIEIRSEEVPISLQFFFNEIRFGIKFKHSEWRRQIRNSFKLSSTEFILESNWNIVNEISRPEIPNLSKFYSTKFDLESNWNFLSERGRPEIVEKKVDTRYRNVE